MNLKVYVTEVQQTPEYELRRLSQTNSMQKMGKPKYTFRCFHEICVWFSQQSSFYFCQCVPVYFVDGLVSFTTKIKAGNKLNSVLYLRVCFAFSCTCFVSWSSCTTCFSHRSFCSVCQRVSILTTGNYSCIWKKFKSHPRCLREGAFRAHTFSKRKTSRERRKHQLFFWKKKIGALTESPTQNWEEASNYALDPSAAYYCATLICKVYHVAFLHLATHVHWTNLVMLYEIGKTFFDNLWGQAEPSRSLRGQT